jgi:hypothetical protein
VVTALRRKYAELRGLGDTEGLEHVGAALLIFDPNHDLDSIPALRPYRGDRDRWSRTALDILRRAAAPLSAPDLAALVMESRGLDPTDRTAFMSVLCSLHATLGKLEGDGLVRIGDRPKRWALAD